LLAINYYSGAHASQRAALNGLPIGTVEKIALPDY
jgi:hypothetical protein